MQHCIFFTVNTVKLLNFRIHLIRKISKTAPFIISWENRHLSLSPALLKSYNAYLSDSPSQLFRRKMSTNKTDAHNNDDSKSSSITETGDLLTSPKNGDLSISKPDSELERNGDTKIEKNEGIESNNETDDRGAVSELPENDHHSSLRHDDLQNEAEENKSNNVTDYEKIKEQFLTLNPEKKRELYKCSKYLTLKQIQIWPDYYSENNYLIERKCPVKRDPNLKFKNVNEGLNKKISLIQDDITSLEVCAIVNAANKTLLGGGGVDGAIHRAAGKYLLKECKTLNGCETGEVKITGGYKLPAKYVIHTVGPIGEKPSKLKNCYLNSLNLLKVNNLKSIAFPCISTGIYGYPNKSAAKVALETVREWLETEDNAENIERIIFCCFLQKDIDIYHAYLPAYFPLSSPAKPAPSTSEADSESKKQKETAC